MTSVDLRREARSFLGEEDFPRIVELWNICEQFDQVGDGVTVNQLRVDFADTWLDVAHNVRLWEDTAGTVIGFAQIWIPEPTEEIDTRVMYQVHPEYRQSDLETQILDWSENRLREIALERGLPIIMRISVCDHLPRQIALLESRNMVVERYSFTMARPLDDQVPEPELPAGFTIREVVGEADGEAWVEMFNQSFIDHWNHHPLTIERWTNWLNDPNGRPELNLIAVGPDGTFAAFCWAGIDPTANAGTGKHTGWVYLLGTRRGFRRIGLGRAILLTGLHRLRACGISTAKLGVDAQSLTGATRLYEAAGFTTESTWIKFAKKL